MTNEASTDSPTILGVDLAISHDCTTCKHFISLVNLSVIGCKQNQNVDEHIHGSDCEGWEAIK